jgi:uncharacterized protein (TIGR03083 family)
MDEIARAGEVGHVAAERTTPLIARLRRFEADLDAPSSLPGWSRLTVACHLRYGATALLRMTSDALAGRETAYYPAGRATQRPTTLVPGPGERPGDVLSDWARAAARLDDVWASLAPEAWSTTVTEPADNADLGPVPLARLALARLTEVDVHGVDLDIGSPDWSTTLVDLALPARLAWLSTRRANHRDVDRSLQGSWLLVGDDLRWTVTVTGDRTRSAPAGPTTDPARATLVGSRRDLLALLLGRPRRRPLQIEGDVEFGAAFGRAFPGP